LELMGVEVIQFVARVAEVGFSLVAVDKVEQI
jgi:hypothetical protein